MRDSIKLAALRALPAGKPASDTLEEVEIDMDGTTALVVRWRFFDSKDKAFREAQFHAETGEYASK